MRWEKGRWQECAGANEGRKMGTDGCRWWSWSAGGCHGAGLKGRDANPKEAFWRSYRTAKTERATPKLVATHEGPKLGNVLGNFVGTFSGNIGDPLPSVPAGCVIQGIYRDTNIAKPRFSFLTVRHVFDSVQLPLQFLVCPHGLSLVTLSRSVTYVWVDLRTETQKACIFIKRDWTTCSKKLIILGSIPNTNVTQPRSPFCTSSPRLLIPFNVIIIHFIQLFFLLFFIFWFFLFQMR